MTQLPIKIVKSRDAATSILRKMGITARDYNLFITKLDSGDFSCRVALAERHLRPKPPEPPPVVKERKPRIQGPHVLNGCSTNPNSVSTVVRRAILNGRSNQDIWEEIREKFNLDDKKKYYPSWYRCDLRRKGLLPAEADRPHG